MAWLEPISIPTYQTHKATNCVSVGVCVMLVCKLIIRFRLPVVELVAASRKLGSISSRARCRVQRVALTAAGRLSENGDMIITMAAVRNRPDYCAKFIASAWPHYRWKFFDRQVRVQRHKSWCTGHDIAIDAQRKTLSNCGCMLLD